MFGKGLKVAALFHCRGNITKYNYPNLITLMQYAYLPPSLHQFSPPFNVFSFFRFQGSIQSGVSSGF